MALISAVDFFDALDHPEMAKVKIPEAARRGDGSFVCSDSYFEEMGNALEEFPILPPRIRRRSSPT